MSGCGGWPGRETDWFGTYVKVVELASYLVDGYAAKRRLPIDPCVMVDYNSCASQCTVEPGFYL